MILAIASQQALHGGDRIKMVVHTDNTAKIRLEGANQYSCGVLGGLEEYSKALERRNVVEIAALAPELAMVVGHQRWGEISVLEHPL